MEQTAATKCGPTVELHLGDIAEHLEIVESCAQAGLSELNRIRIAQRWTAFCATMLMLTAFTFMLLILVASAHGQTVTAGQINMPLANQPAPVPAASAQLVGNPGSQTYYYWIVAKFSAGNSTPAGPILGANAPNTLSGSNFMQISWTPPGGSTGLTYDVLRTTTRANPTGACNCAVATSVAGTSTNDQSNSLNSYTVNTFDPNTQLINLTNVGGQFAVNGTPLAGGGGITTQTNGVNNATQTLLNFQSGTGTTATNPAGGQVQYAVNYGTSAGTAAQGNDARITGALQSANNLSDVANAATARSNLGAAPTASPTFTGTVTEPAPTLNNVTGSTQCLHANTSGVVSGTGSDCGAGGGFSNPMTTPGDMIGGSTAGAAARIPGGLTGQAVIATNGATPSFQSSGIADGNAGAVVTTTPYTVLCDSATAVRDRATTIRFQSGASVINMPDHTASGCGSNFAIILIDDGAGKLTVNRGGTDTFSVFGYAANDGATSFVISGTQHAVLNNGAGGVWEVRIIGPKATGTSTMGTGAIASGACATLVTTSAPGTLTTDTISVSPNTDPTAVTGYGPSASGSLYIQDFPSPDNVNFKVCNNTSGSITPAALTLNWRVP